MILLLFLRLFPQFRALESLVRLGDTLIDDPEWDLARKEVDSKYQTRREADAAEEVNASLRRAIEQGNAPGPGALTPEEFDDLRDRGFKVFP